MQNDIASCMRARSAHRDIKSTSGRLTLRDGVNINLPFHRNSAYFSVFARGRTTYLYYRGGRGQSCTRFSRSEDGINFSEPKILFENDHVCHNFYVFQDGDGRIRGIGGQHVSKSVMPHNDGIYAFVSEDGVTMREEGRIISVDHPGYCNAIDLWGSKNEIDGHLCCLYDDVSNRYLVYVRANIARGVRHIQYASATKFGLFGPFQRIHIDHFDDARDSYYSPSFSRLDEGYVGFTPYVRDDYCCIRVLRSEDGVYWTIVDDLFGGTPWTGAHVAPKNNDHAVNGVIDGGDSIFLYVHHNYFGGDDRYPAWLARYRISKTDLFS